MPSGVPTLVSASESEVAEANARLLDGLADEVGSVAAMESLADVQDLVAYARSVGTQAFWTVDQAVRILAPLRRRAPRDWPCASQRVELWSILSFDLDACDDTALVSFLKTRMPEYEMHFATPAAGCLRVVDTTVDLNEVYSVIKPLLSLPSAQWSDQLGALQLIEPVRMDGRERVFVCKFYRLLFLRLRLC